MMTATQIKTVELALGRIFRLASRPEQSGDIAEYERCRVLILNEIAPDEPWYPVHPMEYVVNRNNGAQGD